MHDYRSIIISNRSIGRDRVERLPAIDTDNKPAVNLLASLP